METKARKTERETTCKSQIRVDGSICCSNGVDCSQRNLTGLYNRGIVYYLCKKSSQFEYEKSK